MLKTTINDIQSVLTIYQRHPSLAYRLAKKSNTDSYLVSITDKLQWFVDQLPTHDTVSDEQATAFLKLLFVTPVVATYYDKQLRQSLLTKIIQNERGSANDHRIDFENKIKLESICQILAEAALLTPQNFQLICQNHAFIPHLYEVTRAFEAKGQFKPIHIKGRAFFKNYVSNVLSYCKEPGSFKQLSDIQSVIQQAQKDQLIQKIESLVTDLESRSETDIEKIAVLQDRIAPLIDVLKTQCEFNLLENEQQLIDRYYCTICRFALANCTTLDKSVTAHNLIVAKAAVDRIEGRVLRAQTLIDYCAAKVGASTQGLNAEEIAALSNVPIKTLPKADQDAIVLLFKQWGDPCKVSAKQVDFVTAAPLEDVHSNSQASFAPCTQKKINPLFPFFKKLNKKLSTSLYTHERLSYLLTRYG